MKKNTTVNRKAKIIFALDVENMQRARFFVDRLYPAVKIFKIGPVLFTAYGPAIVKMVKSKNAQVFLDLKFFDIPNTVASAVRQAVHLGVKMLTLHITGGEEMLIAAVRAAKEESRLSGIKKPLLIGVTVLTSKHSAAGEVLRLARMGMACGLDGVVCSAQEAALLRKKIRRKFMIVTPGIRLDGASADDQKRTATVSQAIEAGSDFLVIGRPILKASDPLKAAKELMR